MERKYLIALGVGILVLAIIVLLLPGMIMDYQDARYRYLSDQATKASYCDMDSDCISVGYCLSGLFEFIVVNKNEAGRIMDLMSKDSALGSCHVGLSNKSVVCTDHTSGANFTNKRCISTVQIS